MSAPIAFDPAGDLPTGLTALEASAGTGKTYALTSLAVRFVAEEGVMASELCIVSFTEAATAELRGRVRSRMVAAAQHLEQSLSPSWDAGSPDQDAVLVAISDTDEAGRRQRLDRLRTAIADLDAATITTIHGFCGRVLAAAGAPSAERRIDTGGIEVAEVVNDLYLARFGHLADTPVRADRIRRAVELHLGMPDSVLHLPDPPTKGRAGSQARYLRDADEARRLVADAAAEVRRRREIRRRRTFDALLADTRSLLAGPDGPLAIAALRERLRLVLIDEFQDTDRVQWDIFRSAFVDRPCGSSIGSSDAGASGRDESGAGPTVVLVGDPKQSIYRFRAAELSAYLDAVATAGSRATLATNWRSDGPLLHALETLFTSPAGDPYEFGSPEVAFAPVAAAPHRGESCLVGDGTEPLVVRLVPGRSEGSMSAPTARRIIADDVVRTVQGLLANGMTLVEPVEAGEPVEGGEVVDGGEGVEGGDVVAPVEGGEVDRGIRRERPLTARDIAVLTRSNADATSLAARLGAAGIPAATSSSNSVLDSEAAEQWRRLLLALERPGSPGRVRAAALGWFIGRRLEEIATLDDAALDELHDELRRWVDELARGGVAALLGVARAAGLDRRLLCRAGGERHATDLDHIAELLSAATSGRGVGPSELLDRLSSLADDESAAPSSDVLARRIDRDDDAVQILTVHKAKGLEFPVVLCPTLWAAAKEQGVPHAQVGDERLIDLSWVADANWTFVKGLRTLARDEIAGEARRLLYVALTRARHRLYVWWPDVAKRDDGGPLGTVLSSASGRTAPPTTPDHLAGLVERSGGTIRVEEVEPRNEVEKVQPRNDVERTVEVEKVEPPVEPEEVERTVEVEPSPTRSSAARGVGDRRPEDPDLSVAVVDREIDRSWRIWSFTAMTSVGGGVAAGVGPPEPSGFDGGRVLTGGDHSRLGAGPGDRPLTQDTDDRPVTGGVDEPSLEELAESTPTGAELDIPQGRLRAVPGGTEFGTLVHEILEHTDFTAATLEEDLLERCAERLRHRSLRVDPVELAAGLADAIRAPLGGSLGEGRLADLARTDRLDELEFHLPLGRLRAGDLGRVLVEHLPADDPFRRWAAGLAEGGHGVDPRLGLRGRLTGSIDLVFRVDGRFHAADYKTNQLGVDHPYDTAGLVTAMEHHHYPLQAILYLVALHRYLRWRVPGYDPAEQLGGAAYLFVRGMHPDVRQAAVGDATAGVLWWHPGVEAIVAVDRLLAGEVS